MIEINLITGKKSGSLTAIGGVDFNKLNIKMIIVAILSLYIPEIFLVQHFDGEIEKANQKNKKLQTELREINKKVRSMKAVEEQVAELKKQEEQYARKLVVVKKIINKRQNPFKVFYYVAQNIPPDVWINSIELEEKRLVIVGYSKSWQSIGIFQENLRNSIFFSKDMQYTQPTQTNTLNNKDNRLSAFQITANIVRFE